MDNGVKHARMWTGLDSGNDLWSIVQPDGATELLIECGGKSLWLNHSEVIRLINEPDNGWALTNENLELTLWIDESYSSLSTAFESALREALQ